jgi:hypothetical protein
MVADKSLTVCCELYKHFKNIFKKSETIYILKHY